MVTLNYPVHIGEFGKDFRKIPYLIADSGDYLSGVNYYIQDRLSGRIDHTGNTRTVFDPPSDDLIKAVSYSLLDAMNWLEWFSESPDSPVPHWTEARPWHFKYLYSNSMLKGYWSQEFWASGNPTPLNPTRTIKPRINEVCSCYAFMAKEGLIDLWEDTPGDIQQWGDDWAKVESLYLEALPQHLRAAREPIYRKRKSPSKTTPPLPKHLTVFFKCFDDEAAFRGARLIFTTGMRIAEVITQTLVPGTIHQRVPENQQLTSLFPRTPYLLGYDPGDDRMIGVMPSLEVAFDERAVCEYRIIGKGPKIRSVPVPHAEMRALWRYRDRTSPIVATGPSAFLLNSHMDPLLTTTLSKAISSASLKASTILGIQLNLTAHALRHAFACRFIEAAILGQAEQAGIDFLSLTSDDIDKFGQGPLLVLKDILGHEWIETTELYLKQLKGGLLGFIYTKMFNKDLDGVEWDNDLAA